MLPLGGRPMCMLITADLLCFLALDWGRCVMTHDGCACFARPANPKLTWNLDEVSDCSCSRRRMVDADIFAAVTAVCCG